MKSSKISESDTVFLSGLASGRPFFNRPLFLVAATLLRTKYGCEVLSPSEMTEQRRLCWAEYMRMEMKLLRKATKVVFMPEWSGGKGSHIENLLIKRGTFKGLSEDDCLYPGQRDYPFDAFPKYDLDAPGSTAWRRTVSRKRMVDISQYLWKSLLSSGRCDAGRIRTYLKNATLYRDFIAKNLNDSVEFQAQDLALPPCCDCPDQVMCCCMMTGAECSEFVIYPERDK